MGRIGPGDLLIKRLAYATLACLLLVSPALANVAASEAPFVVAQSQDANQQEHTSPRETAVPEATLTPDPHLVAQFEKRLEYIPNWKDLAMALLLQAVVKDDVANLAALAKQEGIEIGTSYYYGGVFSGATAYTVAKALDSNKCVNFLESHYNKSTLLGNTGTHSNIPADDVRKEAVRVIVQELTIEARWRATQNPHPAKQTGGRLVSLDVKTHKYHEANCRYFHCKYCKEMPVDEATQDGGVPCKVCHHR